MANDEDDIIIAVPRSRPGEVMSRFAVTPYPAWAFTSALALTFPRANAMKGYYPRSLSCAGFGSVIAFGGYMIHDNDVINGAGFTSAWSILYLLVNGRKAITQLKPWPAFLSMFALGNATLYGREFFFPNSDRTKV
ncbi:hypothetical protein V1512DRAFT_262397 [Lipomyces arxii]|uniref:uncharacterized protein n=1 Tax=Lipomyces arxii TaxID=56418 RepID=UPI0034CE2246